MTDFRFEAVPSGLMNDSLAARIHDPLWFLSRQWQLGEFQGDDVGSPARLDVIGTTAPVGAYALGDGPWHPYDPGAAPLEPLVESAGAPDVRMRVEGGAQFARLLQSRGLGAYRARFVGTCGFAERERRLLAADPLLASIASQVPDADPLVTELAALLEGRAAQTAIDAADRAGVEDAGRQWLDWYRRESGAAFLGNGDAWDPHRFEHVVRVASSAGGGVVLRAGDYAGDALGWPEFDLDPDAPLPAFSLPPPGAVKLSTTPTPVRFGGMPSPRYWEFEDAQFDFGNVDAAGHDLGRLLLLQFAALFGNDWFLVPITLDVGTLTLLEHVIVTDVFGRHFAIGPSADPQWNLFAQQTRRSANGPGDGVAAPHPAAGALFLPPTVGPALESEPLEVVRLLRDETANLVWGVERYCESPLGRRRDRHAEWLATRTEPAADPAGLPRYIVASEVPRYWIPLVPQQLEDRRSIVFVVTPLAVPSGDTFEPAKPEGELLAEQSRISEEEVPRAGATIDRVWKYGRWHDGHALLWKARRKRIGRGEGSSGLRFDVILVDQP